ncbi:hypothetical protein [Pseudochelatococcus contaminans]|uniref:Uncharacterized protein n=1 Tax=Pseudochelatococcus contaminans TaxID=1538103 RepID=A0A7W5Z2R9_9HYPH|nr:hypothetical protein [Pseudochelatococcus contaminans]MBB3808770.1 hypothetical protein [Pseudochelatococcus contaminans]
MPLIITFTTDEGGNDRVSVDGSVEDATVTVTVQRALPDGISVTRQASVSHGDGALIGLGSFDLDEDEDTLNDLPI